MLPFIYNLNKISIVYPQIMNRALADEVSIVAWNIGESTTIGDIDSFTAHHRHAVHIPLGRDHAARVNRITAALTATPPSRRQPVTLEKRPKRSRR
ncbi:MAG: hypothetical protein P0120_16265 [Nitrospira sp.]|nr:hypothetical protein [Nitrospira sp.]